MGPPSYMCYIIGRNVVPRCMTVRVQETQQTPSIRNMKTTPRHIIIKLLKTSDKENLKSSWNKKGHVQKNKDKYFLRVVIRNNANKKTVD